MTENEAIEVLSNELIVITDMIGYCRDFEKESDLALMYRVKRQEAHKIAITALKEIQQYREIGTVEECREAVWKQKPKKPDYEGDGYADRQIVYNTWICPNCGKRYEVDYDDYDYCPNCGQAIYTENLEGMEDERD